MAKIAGAVVVAVWLVMVGLLAQKGYAPDASKDAGQSVQVGEDWMGIYVGGRKSGYAMSRVEKTPDGYSITEEMVAALSLTGSTQEMRTVTRSRVDASLALKDFDFSLKSGVAEMDIKGVVAGRLMQLDVTTAGTSQRVEFSVDEAPHLSAGLELYLRREGLEVGKKFRLPFFDPASLSQQHMDMEVEAREELKLGDRLVPVYRVKQQYAGIVATAWISPELGTVKSEGPMGFTFLKETKEQAMSRPEGGYQPADIIALTSITAKGELPEPRRAASMKARLSGADLSGLELSGGRQELTDGVVTVTRESLESLGKVKLPVSDVALKGFLEPSPFVQSDDPKIRRKAAEVLAGETDVLKAARKLADWVHGSVKKQASAGIPSAVEVLGNLSGDCNEHTVLYTALARSAGIPTRMDAGIVMLDGRFYYHAWPEVYVGGWVSIDPTFGQFPADATHIRFVEGGLDRQIAIVKVIGKLDVEILEYSQ